MNHSRVASGSVVTANCSCSSDDNLLVGKSFLTLWQGRAQYPSADYCENRRDLFWELISVAAPISHLQFADYHKQRSAADNFRASIRGSIVNEAVALTLCQYRRTRLACLSISPAAVLIFFTHCLFVTEAQYLHDFFLCFSIP